MSTTTRPNTHGAIQGIQIGEHRLDVPGRHEAEALADCCPHLDCPRPALTRPAAVLDEVKRGRCVGRYGIYRCPECGFAWLCWWAPARKGSGR